MILLQQNSANNISVSLNSVTRYTSSLFLFEFINGISHEKLYTLAYDSSSYNRYNLFCITTVAVSGSQVATAGQIYSPLSGYYTYNIYESPGASFDPTGLNLVDTGKMLLQSGSSTVQAYTSSNTPFIVYDSSK